MKSREHIVFCVFLIVVAGVVAAQAEVVVFPDAGLNAAVRAAIGKPAGDILDTDLVGAGFYNLDASSRGISDLTGLDRCTDLTTLTLLTNQISDIGPLSGLVNLTHLDLSSNQIANVSALSSLTGLGSLYLGANEISDISPLAALGSLTTLGLWENQVTDIGPLAALSSLTDLMLWDNQAANIGPLASLVSLTHLELAGNGIGNITALSGLVNLLYAGLSRNALADIGPLANLHGLDTLDLRDNQLSDLGPLAGMTQLVQLRIEGNQVSDLRPLAGLTNAARLYLSANAINDISPLAGLNNLTLLELVGNRIADLAPLLMCSGLGASDVLAVAGNPLSQEALCAQIPELQGRWVVVSYDGYCGDASRCGMFSALQTQGDAFAAEQGPGLGLSGNYADWDIEGWPEAPHGDGIPDLWQVRLLADAYCNVNHRLHSAVMTAYEANLAALLTEKPEAAAAWTAMAMSVSAEMRAALCAMFSLDPNHYLVCQDPAKTPNEPFSLTGDCDGDSTNNFVEYQYVSSNGGDINAFAVAASENSPFWQGNPELPATSAVGLILLAAGILVCVRRDSRSRRSS